MQIMENKGSPGILITELKKLRSCAKCIKKPTLITESEISKMFKNVDNSEGSVDTMDKTKTRIVNNTFVELISAEINHTTKKTTAEVQCKEDNSTRKKLNANEPITEEPPKTPTKQVYQNTDIDMLCTPGSLNRKQIILARQNKFWMD